MMRIITLYQPWASLITHGHKSIETRGYSTSYRGPLLIHASKRCDAGILSALAHLQTALTGFGHPRMPEPLPLGSIVAVADLVDCRPMVVAPDPMNEAFGNFGPRRYGWTLENIRMLPTPIPRRGTQGIRGVPAELEAKVNQALLEVAQS